MVEATDYDTTASAISAACLQFVHCKAMMSVVQRVQSNPFTAGKIKIAPRERQGEGAQLRVW